MVVFIDHSLEDASPSEPASGSFEAGNIPPPSFTKDSQSILAASLAQLRTGDSTRAEMVDKIGPERDRDPSSLNGVISMALSCYPYAKTSHLLLFLSLLRMKYVDALCIFLPFLNAVVSGNFLSKIVDHHTLLVSTFLFTG